MSQKKNSENYEVGYKRPPKHSRFKPGQSGNPKGRRKDDRSFDAFLNEELEAKIAGTDENGKKIILSKGQAVAMKLVNSALKGDQRSMSLLMRQLEKQERKESRHPVETNMKEIDFYDPVAAHAAWLASMSES